MNLPGLTVTPINPKTASNAEYAAMHVFANLRRAERLPEEPPIPLEEHIADWQNIPSFVNVYVWIVRPEGSDEIIASADFGCAFRDENRHIGQFGIAVMPSYRRKGIASQLLSLIADTAKCESRTLLMSGSNGRIPAGGAFLEKIGSEQGLVGHTNQLDIAADLDRSLLIAWQEKARERASDYEIVFRQPPVTDEEMQQILHVFNVATNTMPRGDLKMEDTNLTAQNLREMEASSAATGTERLGAFARHIPTGEFVGFSDVSWHPNRPYLLYQGGTGVIPEHRGKGLGRWLKAVMLEKILQEQPGLRFVRTGNADSNEPMLAINHALGFKPFISDIAWQIPTEKVFAYLAAKNADD